MSVVTYEGAAVTLDYYVRAVPSLGTVRVPEYLIFIAVPIGTAPFALEFLRRVFGKDYIIKINNRKVLKGLTEGAGVEDEGQGG